VARGGFSVGYSARDVAQLLDLTTRQIHAYVRAGFLSPRRGVGRAHRFTLQDIVLLRSAKELSKHVPPRKVRRALRRLRERLPSGRPLTGLRITAEGDDIVVHDGPSAWEADSGQRLLDFRVSEIASRVAPLARRAAAAARAAGSEPGADDWYEIACDLESGDPEQARDAYRRALELAPGHADAHVNLGRLLQEAGHAGAAETHYRLALAAESGHATAAFNLGVALEDLGRPEQAIRAYEQALAADPGNADAHYNAARLYERAGRKAAAFRHLKAYRAIVRRV
jgi:tetratricopeptide (TPR) repeat protein